jgi:hypothetical protein
MKTRCKECADFYGEKIKNKKCLRNTNTSYSLILINFIWSDRIRFGPTDFHGLSDRMSDSFFQLSGSLLYLSAHVVRGRRLMFTIICDPMDNYLLERLIYISF